MFKKVYLFFVLCAALSCQASSHQLPAVAGPGDLHPGKQQNVVCKMIAEMITRYNYKKLAINDSISALIFTHYIKALDENHSYFLASDIQGFEGLKTTLDDDINEGNLDNAFYIFNTYKKRYNERIRYSLSQLDKDYNYDQKDEFTYDRDQLPWISSPAEMNDLWDKRVKYDLLNLKLASPDMAKNKETLRKRYQSLLSQSNSLSSQDVMQLFMDALTSAIDPHTSYFNPVNAAEFNIEMSRSVEGIGASLNSENEYITIKEVIAGGPAAKSHLINIDDRIIGVAQGKDGVFQDIIGWRRDNAIPLIRGKKGTIVRLKILPKGEINSEKPKIVELVREKIILQDMSAKKEIRTYQENGKTVKIGIINVPAFYLDFAAYSAHDPNYKSTTRDVKLILDTLKQQHVDGIVIDLRQNGGGSLVEAVSLTGLFIKTGPVVQVRDARNQVEVNEDDDPGITWAGPMAVLVDRLSASASEIFAGAIQDYGRGLILGTQTYGKGTVQNAYNLDDMLNPGIKELFAKSEGKDRSLGQLNLTIAKFYRISGNSTQHKGVVPDIDFPALIPLDKYGEDTEPSALPFDRIKQSNYTKAGNFDQVLPQLRKLHDDRMRNSASYKYLLEDIADFKKQEDEKTVSLNEVTLKQKRDADETKAFEKNNLRREAMGLKPLKKGESHPKDEDLDFLKIEAGQILTDYFSLLVPGHV
ncbi:carboxy terminal-processing peptidase [Pedobacter sp. L105]|uniref:carboxy terminal-processing peptidase n=1 Tax=Pedobacter sp. L105 TaxID=1641871 RepID=UPI00131BAE50|nr:carboxy terminal-processing peptidase [Pedobacter sp. L105]